MYCVFFFLSLFWANLATVKTTFNKQSQKFPSSLQPPPLLFPPVGNTTLKYRKHWWPDDDIVHIQYLIEVKGWRPIIIDPHSVPCCLAQFCTLGCCQKRNGDTWEHNVNPLMLVSVLRYMMLSWARWGGGLRVGGKRNHTSPIHCWVQDLILLMHLTMSINISSNETEL